MSIGITDNKYYADIANAIRSKLGNEVTYRPEEMAAAILQIVTGGGGSMFESNAKGKEVPMPEGAASDKFTLDFVSSVIGSVWSGEPRADVATSFDLDFETSAVGYVESEAPQVVKMFNKDPNGTDLYIEFDKPLVGDLTGLENPERFKYQKISPTHITSLNQYNSSYSVDKLSDGDITTYWRGTSAANWVKFEFDEAKAVTKLRMYTGTYYVKTFTVEGSNDDSVWTPIGEEMSIGADVSAGWREFELDNQTKYKYFRVNTLTGYSSSRLDFYELELYETVPSGNADFFTITIKEVDYSPEKTLVDSVRPVAAIEQFNSVEQSIDFSSGEYTNISNENGVLSLEGE